MAVASTIHYQRLRNNNTEHVRSDSDIDFTTKPDCGDLRQIMKYLVKYPINNDIKFDKSYRCDCDDVTRDIGANNSSGTKIKFKMDMTTKNKYVNCINVTTRNDLKIYELTYT